MPTAAMQPPTPGRVVHYQTDARGGHDYWLPATVIITQENWIIGDGSVPYPVSEYHASLMVMGPGGPYVEHNVPGISLPRPYSEYVNKHLDHYQWRRTWRWPTMR